MPIAYGQVFEDTFLQRVFANQPTGFYVDVGAWHPVKYSISFPFYVQGWRGICIDPLEHYISLANNLRKEDINLQCLLGAAPGVATLHFAHGLDGLSTTVAKYGESIDLNGVEVLKRSYPVRTLAEVLATHGVDEIDFMKIDVEGAEQEVLAGNDWERWKPKVLVIEATVPGTHIPAWDVWEPLIFDHGYIFAGFDTLNRYYVRDDLPQLVEELEIDRKPWDEADYLYQLGSALDNAGHPDALRASTLGKLLCGGIAARPDLAAQLVAAALQDGGDDTVAESLLQRLRQLDAGTSIDWPPAEEHESVTAYFERLLRSDQLRETIGRFSAFLAS